MPRSKQLNLLQPHPKSSLVQRRVSSALHSRISGEGRAGLSEPGLLPISCICQVSENWKEMHMSLSFLAEQPQEAETANLPAVAKDKSGGKFKDILLKMGCISATYCSPLIHVCLDILRSPPLTPPIAFVQVSRFLSPSN